MLVLASPHHKVRNDWLSLVDEPVIAPDQPIFDAHHHLWDRPQSRYLASDFALDAKDGHDVRASLYIQCTTGYRSDGPLEMRPVGEVETVLKWSKEQFIYPIGIVGFADLQLGKAVEPVLDALINAGGGKLCGIRNKTAYHDNSALCSNPIPAAKGQLQNDAFISGAKVLSRHGLCLDIWAYHTQLDEVRALALAVPELKIVVDHCGGPLGAWPYQQGDAEVFKCWRNALAKIAELPNTHIKIGGFGLSVFGYGYATKNKPPLSNQLAKDWAPYVETCIELFGSKRAMFESNFPVDKGQFNYRSLWNAFKRLTQHEDKQTCDDLFWQSAANCYHINQQIFK